MAFESAVTAKAQKMLTKTEEARRLFNLPDTETVVQDYSCSLDGSLRGRMYITQNYVGFSSLRTTELIPFRKITGITREYSTFFYTAIDIIIDNGARRHFSGFMHREEAFQILNHLWKHPPTYVIESENAPETPAQSPVQENTSNRPVSTVTPRVWGGGGAGGDNGFDDIDFPRSSMPAPTMKTTGTLQTQQVTVVKVDTEASKKAVQLALEARQVGVQTLEELSLQAETLDRIEQDIENIHANLDRGDRYLRGIEGVGGAIKNAFTKDPKKFTAPATTMHTITLQRTPKVTDIEILMKNEDDSLMPTILRFAEKELCCLSSDTKQKIPGASWIYEQITQVVMRARHLHMDIRFVDPIPRFRLMSSYLQAITNEIILRTSAGQVSVAFEPGVKRFQFGSFAVADNVRLNPGRANLVGNTTRVVRPVRVSQLLSEHASQETRMALEQQERDLDTISDVLSDLGSIAGAMGNEIIRQNNQLDRVGTRVDQANERLHRNNFRVQNILS